MAKNIIFKTDYCAFAHLLNCRLYFAKMAAVNKYIKRHNIKQFGFIESNAMLYCKEQFSQAEKNSILYLTNKAGNQDFTEQDTIEHSALIEKMDRCINDFLAQ